ncbi:tonB-dependent siderophore receptor family protein [Novosphingobium sp. Rr 2-17]|uniref:TonB-dependent siderophore receptor n=1 Tax=Novosphingobium sp. Rr 2-17 TaxID=555793 RepID=UPI0002699C24|nr:TonB-dependent siderophore receptor [Novosphingobium sp. Rr 2-17]EIZ77382.1 tonB-dependent siderophore receptor family protein [Novosphingobium sp. Rr 2-17]
MRLPIRRQLLASTIVFALYPFAEANAADANGTDATDEANRTILVTAATRHSSSATALSLPVDETPQSVTIIDRKRIEDFSITNINDLLDQAVGINVERVETDRTYFSSRGFDVSNFQVDGIGLPLSWGLQVGDLDTALFENVEVVRGANAIMTGIGNPSATINYVRKRPTDELAIKATAQGGSRNYWRGEADVNVPLTDTLALRAIYAHEQSDGYLDYNHVNRNVYGAIVRWQATPNLRATIGYTRQQNEADGVLWGAIPLVYSDGSRIDLKRSTTTSADWTYWNTRDQSIFGELVYNFDNDWSVTGIFTYRRFQENAKLLYAYGYPDKETGEGVYGMSGIYPSDYKQYLGDVYLSGPFHLFGREHKLALGVSVSRSDAKEWENFAEDTALVYPSIYDWGSQQVAEPSYPGAELQSDYTDRLTRVYGAAHLNFTDRLKVVVGASAMWIDSTGYSYGISQARTDNRVSPYLGAVYDLTGNVSFYASYTDIYNPQTEVDANNRRLDPAKGTSLEAGIKSTWLGGKLYATAAVFKAKQKGLADYAGTFDGSGAGKAGDSYYTGVDTTSTGFELEVAGNLTDQWTLSGGFTWLNIEDAQGNDTRTWIPTKSLKLATTYTVPQLNDLKLGAQLRWQNTTRTQITDLATYGGPDEAVTVKQKGYAVLDLMAGIKVIDHLKASVNVRNVTDKKYLNSLKWGQAYYAAPRSAVVSVTFEY